MTSTRTTPNAATREATVASAWIAHSRALAEWTLQMLVNRRDVWGSYLPLARRTKKVRADGSTYIDRTRTAPPVASRGKEFLTVERLARHFRGECHGHVLGVHSTAPDNTCRWCCIEIDQHAEANPRDAMLRNLRAAQHWMEELSGLYIQPLLIDSDGKGGLHLWIIFCEPVPTATVHHFARWLVRDFRDMGFEQPPETFPKQASIDAGGFGNWLRLPGLHHSRPHFSRVWDDNLGRWAEGQHAIGEILASLSNHPSALPAAGQPPPAPPPLPPAPAKPLPPRKPWADGGRTDADVALECLAHVPNGGCHYDQWFTVGCALHHATGGAGEGLNAWESWSACSSKHTAGECARVWAAIKTGRDKLATVATLIELARRHGYEPYPRRAVVEVKPATPVAPTRTPFRINLPDAPVPSRFGVLASHGEGQ